MISAKEHRRFAVICLTESLNNEVLDYSDGGPASQVTSEIKNMFSDEFLNNPETLKMFTLLISVSTAAAIMLAENEEFARSWLHAAELATEMLPDD